MKNFLNLLIIIVGITVLSAWTFRLEMDTIYRGADASNMIEEFQAYGLNKTTMIVVGIFKVLCAIFLLLGLKFKKFHLTTLEKFNCQNSKNCHTNLISSVRMKYKTPTFDVFERVPSPGAHFV